MISVIVTTFERPRHLAAALAALGRQEPGEAFEIVVADDGSKDETEAVVASWSRSVEIPCTCVTQSHVGFQLARVRNVGVAASSGDYLVFLDGDCLACDGFLRAHAAARRAGAFVVASRVDLSAEDSASIGADEVARRGADAFLPRGARGALRRRAFKDRVYRGLRLKNRPKIIGANFALARSDYEAVNGFDERFVGWGYEDEDFARRLERLGLRKRSAVSTAVVLHQWHAPVPSFHGRARASANRAYFDRGYFLTVCRRGLARPDASQLRVRARRGSTLAAEFVRAEPGERADFELIEAAGAPPTEAGADVRVAVVGAGERSPSADLVVTFGAGDDRGALLRAALEEL